MTAKSKKKLYAVLLVAVGIFGYCLWLSLRPVEIVAVHKGNESSDVLVKNFPFTDRGKIDWWLKNKEILKAKYNIPHPARDGDFSVFFWLFGDGYKVTDGYDRLCFNDMKPPINCIEKDAVFSVERSKNMGTVFTVYDGTYILQKNGEIVKYSYN